MEVLAITWWMWIVGGLGLMAMEAFLPAGFYLFFLGLAALGTGTVTWLGLTATLFKQGMAMLIFMGIVVALRKPVVSRFKLTPQTVVDSMIGETAVAMEAIAAHGAGRVELRGSTWSARNMGDAEIPARAKCRVERVDELTLEVRT